MDEEKSEYLHKNGQPVHKGQRDQQEPDHSPDGYSSAEDTPVILDPTHAINEKALLRKIDFRVIPILFLICASFQFSVSPPRELEFDLGDLHWEY